MDAARLTLLTRPGCHLCDDARAVVSAVAEETGVSWREVDLGEWPDPDPLWREQIPVLLLDGAVHGYWRVDAGRLRAAVA